MVSFLCFSVDADDGSTRTAESGDPLGAAPHTLVRVLEGAFGAGVDAAHRREDEVKQLGVAALVSQPTDFASASAEAERAGTDASGAVARPVEMRRVTTQNLTVPAVRAVRLLAVEELPAGGAGDVEDAVVAAGLAQHDVVVAHVVSTVLEDHARVHARHNPAEFVHAQSGHAVEASHATDVARDGLGVGDYGRVGLDLAERGALPAQGLVDLADYPRVVPKILLVV